MNLRPQTYIKKSDSISVDKDFLVEGEICCVLERNDYPEQDASITHK